MGTETHPGSMHEGQQLGSCWTVSPSGCVLLIGLRKLGMKKEVKRKRRDTLGVYEEEKEKCLQ